MKKMSGHQAKAKAQVKGETLSNETINKRHPECVFCIKQE